MIDPDQSRETDMTITTEKNIIKKVVENIIIVLTQTLLGLIHLIAPSLINTITRTKGKFVKSTIAPDHQKCEIKVVHH